MFKIDEENGCITVDYDRVIGVYKYGVLYMDNGEVEEIHLPQTMAAVVKRRYEEYIEYEENVGT